MDNEKRYSLNIKIDGYHEEEISSYSYQTINYITRRDGEMWKILKWYERWKRKLQHR